MLEDLFSQNYKNFNLIISDNASEDNSYQISMNGQKKIKIFSWLDKKKN